MSFWFCIFLRFSNKPSQTPVDSVDMTQYVNCGGAGGTTLLLTGLDILEPDRDIMELAEVRVYKLHKG